MFGLELFKNWMFVVYLISVPLSYVPHDSLHWFIPDRAIEIGISKHKASMTAPVLSAANLLSRFFFGFISSKQFHYSLCILVIYTFSSGINVILAVFWWNFPTYMIFVVLFGLMRGLFKIYQMTILVDIVGKENSHHGYGMVLTATGFAYILFGPIFGYLNETSGSYTITFLVYGFMEIIGGIILSIIPIYILLRRNGYFSKPVYQPQVD